MLLGRLIIYIKVVLFNVKDSCLFIYIKGQSEEKKPVVQTI